MCCIIATPGKKTRPTLATLRAIHRSNPDGAGVAWLSGDGKVRFEKGLGPDEVHDCFTRVAGPAIAHFRWATVGAKCAELCHPFVIGDDGSPLATEGTADAVLFHNGHWSDWAD